MNEFSFFVCVTLTAKYAMHKTLGTGDSINVTPVGELTTSLTFTLKADEGAFIKLTGVSEDEQFEVVLNAIAKSLIRNVKTQTVITQRTMANLYNATVYTAFWISWTNGVVKVGRGEETGRNVFLQSGVVFSKASKIEIGTMNQHVGYWKIMKGQFNVSFVFSTDNVLYH